MHQPKPNNLLLLHVPMKFDGSEIYFENFVFVCLKLYWSHLSVFRYYFSLKNGTMKHIDIADHFDRGHYN